MKTVWCKIGTFGHIRVTPLMKACVEGDLESVLSLLGEIEALGTMGAELSAGDDWWGSSPLHWAGYAGNAEVVEALLSAKSDPALKNSRGRALALHLAARYNTDPSGLEYLVAAAPETVNATNAVGNTPLHEAAYEGRAANAESLLHAGSSVEIANHRTERGGL